MKVRITKEFNQPARLLRVGREIEVDDEFGEVLLKHGAERLDKPKRAPIRKAVARKAETPETIQTTSKEDSLNDDQV